MKCKRASENEILTRLNQAARESGVVLTFAHRRFFLRLLDLAERTGEAVEDGLAVTLTVRELSEAVRIPLRTTIQSLNRLTACGILRREGKNTFPRSTTTTLIKTFYERE